jgi:hypothetical protein
MVGGEQPPPVSLCRTMMIVIMSVIMAMAVIVVGRIV